MVSKGREREQRPEPGEKLLLFQFRKVLSPKESYNLHEGLKDEASETENLPSWRSQIRLGDDTGTNTLDAPWCPLVPFGE